MKNKQMMEVILGTFILSISTRQNVKNEIITIHHHAFIGYDEGKIHLYVLYFVKILEVKLPYDPVCLSVGWLVSRVIGLSVCHNFPKGREVSLPCS